MILEMSWNVPPQVTDHFRPQLQATINLAQARNAGWVYISDSPNTAYNQVPVYWSAEGTAVKTQGVQAPSLLLGPPPTTLPGPP
jgi:hypothetical protein